MGPIHVPKMPSDAFDEMARAKLRAENANSCEAPTANRSTLQAKIEKGREMLAYFRDMEKEWSIRRRDLAAAVERAANCLTHVEIARKQLQENQDHANRAEFDLVAALREAGCNLI